MIRLHFVKITALIIGQIKYVREFILAELMVVKVVFILQIKNVLIIIKLKVFIVIVFR
jgi:hypothetical protein